MRSGSLLNDCWKTWAVPAKLPCTVVGLGDRLLVKTRGLGRILGEAGEAIAVKVAELIEGADGASIGGELVIGDRLGGIDGEAKVAGAIGIAQAHIGISEFGVRRLAEIFEPLRLILRALGRCQQRQRVFQRRGGIAGIGLRLEIGLGFCRGGRGGLGAGRWGGFGIRRPGGRAGNHQNCRQRQRRPRTQMFWHN